MTPDELRQFANDAFAVVMRDPTAQGVLLNRTASSVSKQSAAEYEAALRQLRESDGFKRYLVGERRWTKDEATGIAMPEGAAAPNPFAGIADLPNTSAGSYWGADPIAQAVWWQKVLQGYMGAPKPCRSPPALRVDPDVKTEVVYGYRSFRLDASRNLSLYAVSKEIQWPRFMRFTAACNRVYRKRKNEAHAAPEADCTCGIYAVRDAKQARKTGGSIFAKVALWGRIIVCSGGYRAQYAYPQTLYLTGTNDEVVRAIAPLYGCSMEKMP